MRVVAGEFRGRKLVAPPGTTTRPTTDKVREAVFNALGSMNVLDGALVADLYAGTGALGLEALSRGAEHVTFVETDRAARRALVQNIESLDVRDRVRVMTADTFAVVGALDVDLVFADPPYEFDRWQELLSAVASGRTGAPSLVVAESAEEFGVDAGWEITRAKRYGRTWVTFLEPTGQ
jgi:16S rRNA (guanine966-N2)-methyltransferase